MFDDKKKALKDIIEKRNNMIIPNIYKLNQQHIKDKEIVDNLKIQNSCNFLKNYNYSMLKKICLAFNELSIKYIVLKGCMLSYLLYDDPTYRISSDIDIFVYPDHLNLAIKYMQQCGFIISNTDVSHHYVFKNKKCSVEIHQNILNPLMCINEDYLRSNLKEYCIKGNKIYGMTITATLIHLFYHLYMHSYMSVSHYSIIKNGGLPRSKTLVYRIYEIVLLVNKYKEFIDWLEFYDEISSQNFNVYFKFFLAEIIRYFPKIIPPVCAIKLLANKYHEYEKNTKLNKLFHQYDFACSDVSIRNYIDENWSQENSNIIQNINHYVFKDNNDCLSAEFEITKDDNDLNLLFKICDEDVSFSGLNDFNTLQSDGVHLLFCNTYKYSYSSIFLFPKLLGDMYTVYAYDCILNEIIEDRFIEASCETTSYGYDLRITLKNEFFCNKKINKFFYLGVIISNCKKDCERRVSSLIHTELESEWFDPTHFIKIEIKN